MPAILKGKTYYSLSELSYMLGISKEWLRTLVHRWNIPIVQVGNKFFIPEKYAKKIAGLYGTKL